MNIKWTDEDREIPVPNDAGGFDEVDVHRGKVVDLPVDISRSLIKQGHAEAHPDKKPAKKAAAKAVPEPVPSSEENV